jgi:hypothetical protein
VCLARPGSSRRRAASSSSARRPTSRSGTRVRQEGEPEEAGQPGDAEAKAAAEKRRWLLIGSIAGACLIVIVALVFLSGPKRSPPKAPAPKAETAVPAGAPPEVYEKLARELEAKGEKRKARQAWLDAANAADARGQTSRAESDNQQAYRIGKSMTLQDTER